MHMFIQGVRVPLDFSLDDANLLVACLRSYAKLKSERADRAVDDARQMELNGMTDAETLAERVVNQIDERIIEIERRVQAFHDAGMNDRAWVPETLASMETRLRGWDTVEGGACYTRGGE